MDCLQFHDNKTALQTFYQVSELVCVICFFYSLFLSFILFYLI